jgi:hypothetical protein
MAVTMQKWSVPIAELGLIPSAGQYSMKGM